MGIWTDLATWRGPTVNCGDGDGVSEPGDRLAEHRGVVVHIAAGYFEGTIAWQRNPAADVSSHFVVAKDGRIAQMVDTDIRAWTQRAGNRTWLSIENEGFLHDKLTAAQVEANAKLLARAHREHGVPLQIASSPAGRGLGHHSMGAENGVDWGHSQCPGKAIVAQKGEIVARAIEIVAGRPARGQEDEIVETVKIMQAGLKDLGHDPGPIDGEPGPKTLSALTALIAEKVNSYSYGTGGKKLYSHARDASAIAGQARDAVAELAGRPAPTADVDELAAAMVRQLLALVAAPSGSGE